MYTLRMRFISENINYSWRGCDKYLILLDFFFFCFIRYFSLFEIGYYY